MQLPRPIKSSLLPLLVFFAAQKICAQLAPADDFFNGGAQLYISNNIPAAMAATESGLKLYPDDEKLKKLEQLLKQQQQQQQQNQQNQKQESQSQQNSKSQQKQQQQQQQSQQNQAGQKKDEQQKQAEQQKTGEEKKQNDEDQPVAGQMTPEEAKRLLDAQKDNEQVLQMKPQDKPENPNQKVKDW